MSKIEQIKKQKYSLWDRKTWPKVLKYFTVATKSKINLYLERFDSLSTSQYFWNSFYVSKFDLLMIYPSWYRSRTTLWDFLNNSMRSYSTVLMDTFFNRKWTSLSGLFVLKLAETFSEVTSLMPNWFNLKPFSALLSFDSFKRSEKVVCLY
jgi:hypothetical protein